MSRTQGIVTSPTVPGRAAACLTSGLWTQAPGGPSSEQLSLGWSSLFKLTCQAGPLGPEAMLDPTGLNAILGS